MTMIIYLLIKGLVETCVPKRATLYSPPSINATLINVNSLYSLTKAYSPHIANYNVDYVTC